MSIKLCECGCGEPAPIATKTKRSCGHVKGQPIRFVRGHSGRCFHRKLHYRGHGMSSTAEYAAYLQARRRCTDPNNPNWKNYGGRGIKFLFESFEQFMFVLGNRPSPQHSLDRFPNNDGHYEPGNVRWATAKEQQANRRCTPKPTSTRYKPTPNPGERHAIAKPVGYSATPSL